MSVNHPETGRVFQREKWDPDVKKELLMKSRNRENEEEEEQETEDLEEEVIQPAVGFQKCLTSKTVRNINFTNHSYCCDSIPHSAIN